MGHTGTKSVCGGHSKLTEVSGTRTLAVPNLPCRVGYTPVLENLPNLPMCRIPVPDLYRSYRSVGYRYQVRTNLTEVSGTSIDRVPNKYPYPRHCGRGYSDTQGTGIEIVPH